MPEDRKRTPRYKKGKRFENPQLEVVVVKDDPISPVELENALRLLASWIAALIRDEAEESRKN
jgi:hypothetical protein